jgi:hypothetical protein
MKALAAALRRAQDAARRSRWSEAAERYGAQSVLYEGRARAAEIIMAAAAERTRARTPATKPASPEVVYVVETGHGPVTRMKGRSRGP